MTPGRAARRALHALLGAVVLLPYLGLGWVLTVTAREGAGPVALVLLTAPAVLVGLGVLVLPGVRELATTAARSLLDADLPARDVAYGGRLRAAGWILLGTGCGALGASALLYGLPQAVGLLVAPWEALPGLPTGAAAWWTPVAAPVVLAVAVAVPVLLGAGQARIAGRVLGPTPAERLADELAATRRRAEQEAGHARLARELHDSVGHALTVTTVQAAAADELLDTDPAFARRALEAVAATGRAALDDLDHVLGLLRTGEGPPEPVRDLGALDDLLDRVRAAGTDLRADVGQSADVPAVVSREAYRVAQEGLTNALRHGGAGPVSVSVHRTAHALELRIANPVGAGAPRPGGGRGIDGAADRVTLLGGTLTAGPDGGRWVLHAVLPAPAGRSGCTGAGP